MNSIRDVRRHRVAAIPDAAEDNVTFLGHLIEVEIEQGSFFSACLYVNNIYLAAVAWTSERPDADDIRISWHGDHGETDPERKTEGRLRLESCLRYWAGDDFDLREAITVMREPKSRRCHC